MSVVIHWALCEIEHVIEIYQFLRANLSRIFTPVFRHSFSTASRRIRDAMVHPCVSLFPRSSNFHYTRASFFFFANFIYFQARRKIIKFHRILLYECYIFSKFSLRFRSIPQFYLKFIAIIYIYIYPQLIRRFLRKRLGGFICNNVQATRFWKTRIEKWGKQGK